MTCIIRYVVNYVWSVGGRNNCRLSVCSLLGANTLACFSGPVLIRATVRSEHGGDISIPPCEHHHKMLKAINVRACVPPLFVTRGTRWYHTSALCRSLLSLIRPSSLLSVSFNVFRKLASSTSRAWRPACTFPKMARHRTMFHKQLDVSNSVRKSLVLTNCLVVVVVML